MSILNKLRNRNYIKKEYNGITTDDEYINKDIIRIRPNNLRYNNLSKYSFDAAKNIILERIKLGLPITEAEKKTYIGIDNNYTEVDPSNTLPDTPSGDGFNISDNGLASWEYKDTDIRKDWDSYFIDIAKMVATRSTCDRLSVGCVIVKNHRIISTGYNGSVSGTDHCDEEGHLLVNGRCVRTVHAEQNAILFAKGNIDNAIVYITHEPCEICLKLLVQAGVSEIIYANEYYNETTALLKAEYCRKCKIHKYMG